MSDQNSDAAVRDVMRTLEGYGVECHWHERSDDEPDDDLNRTGCRIVRRSQEQWQPIALDIEREWESRIAAYVKRRVYASGQPFPGFYRVRA